jgi:hypothetical protein
MGGLEAASDVVLHVLQVDRWARLAPTVRALTGVTDALGAAPRGKFPATPQARALMQGWGVDVQVDVKGYLLRIKALHHDAPCCIVAS